MSIEICVLWLLAIFENLTYMQIFNNTKHPPILLKPRIAITAPFEIRFYIFHLKYMFRMHMMLLK